MFNVTIYTDGACSGNPGPGGYCAILKYGEIERIVCGGEKNATNNRMELKAVVEAVKSLKKPCHVELITDSQYLCNCSCHTYNWLTGKDRPNRDLWIELIQAGNKGGHKIKFVKIQGHSGDKTNDRCDKIAKEQIVKMRHELLKGE